MTPAAFEPVRAALRAERPRDAEADQCRAPGRRAHPAAPGDVEVFGKIVIPNSVQIDLGAIRFCNCTIAQCGDNWNWRAAGPLHIHHGAADFSADWENFLELSLLTIVVALAGTFLIAFMKGGFGGG